MNTNIRRILKKYQFIPNTIKSYTITRTWKSSHLSVMTTHSNFQLPPLLNPLLNAICNCGEPNSSPLKKLYTQLGKKDKYLILVPPTELLLYYSDKESNSELHDLCYTPNFASAHILLLDATDTEVNNGDEAVLIKNIEKRYDVHFIKAMDQSWKFINWKNRVIYEFNKLGDQIKNRAKILDIESIPIFNNYMKTTDNTITIMYIDDVFLNGTLECNLRSDIDLLRSPSMRSIPTAKRPSLINKNSTDYENSKSKATFDSILRVNKHWSSKFEQHFQKFRLLANQDDLPIDVFHNIIEEMHEEMVSDNLFKNIVDLRNIIYEYVELNLFDDIWKMILKMNKEVEIDLNPFGNISIYQVDSEFLSTEYSKFFLENITTAERNIKEASKSLQKIESASNYKSKANILILTLRTLTGNKENDGYSSKNDDGNLSFFPLAIDADRLMNLFVLVTCRAQIKNLKCHLSYLQNFYNNDSDTKFGILGYALSTLEAVVCYFEQLKEKENYRKLIDFCNSNERLVKVLSSTKKYETNAALSFLRKYEGSLRYRDSLGQSLLALCIIHGRNDFLYHILNEYETLFPIEDLLADESIDGSTLLIQAVKHDNQYSASLLLNILKDNCTEIELIAYINRHDINKRTAGHFLTNELEVLKLMGKYINWVQKDNAGQTPLFTIFRSYDQDNYDEMVSQSMEYATNWYGLNGKNFNYLDHVDKKGNTLLHILKCNLPILLADKHINVNATNRSGQTPLMTSIRYKRTENIRDLLCDPRLRVDITQKNNALTAFDFSKDDEITHLLGEHELLNSPWLAVYAHTLKYTNSRWNLSLTVKLKDTPKTTNFTLKTLRGILRVVIKNNMTVFLPVQELVEDLISFNRIRFSELMRIKVLEMLPFISFCLSALVHIKVLDLNVFQTEENAIKWVKMNGSVDKKTNQTSDITPEDISMIQNFLKFNITEIERTKNKLEIAEKLSLFLRLKSKDLLNSNENYVTIVSQLSSKRFRSTLKYSAEDTKLLSVRAEKALLSKITYLKICAQKLHNHILSITMTMISNWWHIYGELLNAHKHYTRAFPELANVTTENRDLALHRMISNPKRIKLEERLSEKIKDITEQLNSVGHDIKQMHELAAEEVSRFIDLKTKFTLEYALQSYLTISKQEHIEKDRLHWEFQENKTVFKQ